jgi:hypothetical protein
MNQNSQAVVTGFQRRGAFEVKRIEKYEQTLLGKMLVYLDKSHIADDVKNYLDSPCMMENYLDSPCPLNQFGTTLKGQQSSESSFSLLF